MPPEATPHRLPRQLAAFKAEVLNALLPNMTFASVIEFARGDGSQLASPATPGTSAWTSARRCCQM